MKRVFTHHFFGSLLLVAAVAAGLASCSKQDAEPAPDKGDGQIRLTSQIASSPAGGTRAPIADSEVKVLLENIRILRKDSTAMPKDFTNLVPLNATRDRAGKITFATTQLYDRLTNRNAYFIAFWPNSNTALSGTTVSWTIGGKQDILIAGPWDAGNYTTSRSSGMVFEHPLARLEVVCRVASESEAANIRATWGSITKIEIAQTYQYLTYDLKTQQVKHWEDKKATLPLWKADYAATFAPIVIPDAVSTDVVAAGMFAPQKGSILLRVTTEKMGVVTREVLLRKGGEHVDFESGKRHRVTLEFDKNQLVVSPYADITDWETVFETDGEIELPSDVLSKPSEGIIDMRYPALVKSGMSNSISYTPALTRESYNPYINTQTNATGNGGYFSTSNVAIASEKVYYKFEVSKADRRAATWQDAWRLCKETAPVGAWRLPRASEIFMMYINRVELEKTPGFTSFLNSTMYMSGTEQTGGINALGVNFAGGSGSNSKTTTTTFRCVRELGHPQVGDYYYTDKTYSTGLISGRNIEGAIFWVDPANPKRFKIVSMDQESNLQWAPQDSYVLGAPGQSSTDGKTNVATMKTYSKDNTNNSDPGKKTTGVFAKDFPAAAFCDNKNTGGVTGWYLPAMDELNAFGTAYTTNKPAFDTAISAGGGDPMVDGIIAYWSSTEDNQASAQALAYDFGFGSEVGYTKTFLVNPVRCIREITL